MQQANWLCNNLSKVWKTLGLSLEEASNTDTALSGVLCIKVCYISTLQSPSCLAGLAPVRQQLPFASSAMHLLKACIIYCSLPTGVSSLGICNARRSISTESPADAPKWAAMICADIIDECCATRSQHRQCQGCVPSSECADLAKGVFRPAPPLMRSRLLQA